MQSPAALVRRSTVLLRDPWVWQGLVLAAIAGVALWTTISTDRDFWYDEAMLVQAIRHDGWLAPGESLSLYEQVSPWGDYVLEKLSISALGLHPDLLRVPSLLAYVLAGFTTWAAARLWFGGTVPLFAGVVPLTSAIAVQSGGDFKHYVFEELAAAALLLALAMVRRGRSPLLLAATSIATIPFSNTSVFVVPGVALACLLVTRRRITVVIGFLCFVVAWATWFLSAIRPSSVFQLAYPEYATGISWNDYTALVSGVAQPDGAFLIGLFTLIGAAVIAAGIWRPRDLVASLPLGGAVVLLSAAFISRAAPILYSRHVLFLVPLVAFSTAAAFRTLAALAFTAVPPPAARRGIAVVLLAGVAALSAAVPVPGSAGLQREQIGTLMLAQRTTCPAYEVDWWTQPTATLYADATGTSFLLHGVVDASSGKGQGSWSYRVRNDPSAYQRQLVAWMTTLPTTCVLTGDYPGEADLVFAPLKRAGFTCTVSATLTGAHLSRCTRPS